MLTRIRSRGQWLFLQLDAAANSLFGERLNPLYYLGAISYWMLWVSVASGLYAYIFYRTGVDTTYASVEALTHGQWYLGGVMRSIHRYSSDAMVVTMLLHSVRHFVFDAYRGFRAFSWITGVVVLMLVYASGVNGYMLPWDQRAQFVVTATAEWFDRLPVFGGLLIRNFVYVESISDRFFSLLSFLHIGIPLALIALLWVHTQRVPRARTLPPRAIAYALLGMLVALSLASPALSLGPANLATVPARIDIDWFYLGAYPLVYEWSPAKLWLLVAGGLALLFAAPWLPPRRAMREAAARIMLHPGNRLVTARAGESILDAGLRGGVSLPFECRNGGCGVCKATLLAGSVDYGAYQPSALSDAERRGGKLLLCCATPLADDVEVEYEESSARARSVRSYGAVVEGLERLAPDVMHVRLRLADGERMRFEAGQFVNIVLADGARRSYSFTTAPCETETIDLHIRLIPGGRFTSHVFDGMTVGETLLLEGPFGNVSIRDGTQPLILVAGATGFAPVKSVLEHAFAAGFRRPLVLYWGVRRRCDLYLSALPEQWQREHSNFRYIPVLSAPAPEDAWTGRTGLVHEAILADYPDLSGFEMYVCGSVKMLDAARPAFLAHGLHEDACFTDIFVSSERHTTSAKESSPPSS